MSGTIPTVASYLGLIPPYNSKQPQFIATLTAALQPLVGIQNVIASMPQAFDLDVAIGAQLDVDGIWIGRNRNIAVPIADVFFSWDIDGLGWEQGFWQGTFDPDEGISVLDDETYRKLLYAKAAANVGDTSMGSLVNIMNDLLDGEGVSATIIDNLDMTMQVVIAGSLQNLIMRSIIIGGYVPIKPAGVAIDYLVADPLQFPVSATITGLGGVIANAGHLQLAGATIHGQGNISIGGFVAVFSPVQGVGNVSAHAVARLAASATINMTGGVIAVANQRQPISATIAGTATILTGGSHTQFAGATVVGTGAVTVAAVQRQIAAPLPITISGLVTGSATVLSQQVSATIAGTGSVTASAVANLLGKATITGTGLISATVQGQSFPNVVLVGTGSVVSNAAIRALATPAIISPVGSLVANTHLRLAAKATIAGAGLNIFNTITQAWGASNVWNTASLNNLRLTKTGEENDYTSTLGTTFFTSGLKYWEINITTMPDVSDIIVGIANSNFSVSTDNNYIGADTQSWGWFHNEPYDGNGGEITNAFGITTDMAGFKQGDRCCLALNVTALKWWGRVNGGLWNAGFGGTQDPASNAGGHIIPSGMVAGKGLGPAVSLYDTGNVIDGCFAATSWNFTPPTGYGAM